MESVLVMMEESFEEAIVAVEMGRETEGEKQSRFAGWEYLSDRIAAKRSRARRVLHGNELRQYRSSGCTITQCSSCSTSRR